MSIYIKGMEMPTSCFYCPFREKVNPDDYVCMALNKEFEETFSLIAGHRHKDCPLVPVPEHGDLIDADKLVELCDIMADKCDGIGASIWHQFKTTVEWSPIVIPADKEGEE